jgi:hypothetical protein
MTFCVSLKRRTAYQLCVCVCDDGDDGDDDEEDE